MKYKSLKEYWESEDAKVHYNESVIEYEKYANEIIRVIEPEDGERILDIGCAHGEVMSRVASRCNAKFVGMDFSSRLIMMATEKYPTLEWVEGNALEKWKFDDESFDKVYSFGFMQYIPHNGIEHVLKETKRVLKREGTAFHMNVPDKTKFSKYFNTPYKMLRVGIKSYMTNRVFKDRSYWHKPAAIKDIACKIGMDATVTDSAANYRSDFTFKVGLK